MLVQYGSVAAFVIVAVAFMVGSLLFGALLRPRHPSGQKLDTYECGEPVISSPWFNFNPRFYLVALVFIIFDVEVALIYPVAAVFRRWVIEGRSAGDGRQFVAFFELFGFVAVLLVGLVYVWKRRDLEWISRSETALPLAPVAVSRAGVVAVLSDEGPTASPMKVEGS